MASTSSKQCCGVVLLTSCLRHWGGKPIDTLGKINSGNLQRSMKWKIMFHGVPLRRSRRSRRSKRSRRSRRWLWRRRRDICVWKWGVSTKIMEMGSMLVHRGVNQANNCETNIINIIEAQKQSKTWETNRNEESIDKNSMWYTWLYQPRDSRYKTTQANTNLLPPNLLVSLYPHPFSGIFVQFWHKAGPPQLGDGL